MTRSKRDIAIFELEKS